jgi:chitinase
LRHLPAAPAPGGDARAGLTRESLRSGTNPSFRGLMTWSINWDKFYGWEFQNQNGAFVKNLP